MMRMRMERDGLGELPVPENAYYGIVTQRSQKAYDISPRTLKDYPEMINATALCKIACARANAEIGALKPEYAKAIEEALKEIIDGKFKDEFVVNVFRGFGTPVNMEVNEIAAHRANEILTGDKNGPITPNSHVNMSQSTGDISPTSKNIVVHDCLERAARAAESVIPRLRALAKEHALTIKMGRTLAQDALPVTYGMTFAGYADALERTVSKIRAEEASWNVSSLGGTAIGTGMGAQPGYRAVITKHLSEVLGREVVLAKNLPETMGATEDFLRAYSQIECAAFVLWRIGRDILFLASGPACGLNEIELEDTGAGNEDQEFAPELLIQMTEKVLSGRAGLLSGLQTGWLEMGALSGIPFKIIIESTGFIERAFALLDRKILSGLKVNKELCRAMVEKSTSLAVMVSTLLGYAVGTKVAHYAIDHDVSCKEAAKALKVLPDDVLDELFDPANMVDGDKLEALFTKYEKYRKI